MFKTRLLSGAVLLALLIFVIVNGGNLLLAFTGIISLIGQYELYRAVKLEKSLPAVTAYLAGIVYVVFLYFGIPDRLILLAVLFFLLLMVVYVISYPKYVIEQMAVCFFGFFYVNVMLSYLYQVRMGTEGALAVWLIIISAWGSDTCAYCTGMLIGKHKLPSPLSPKKTIEGCIGGVVGAALIGFIYGMVFKDSITEISSPQVVFAIVGAVGSIIAQFGDLCASAIKRNHEIKDYGRLIPGHGGILDRFDSIIFTAPAVYVLLLFLAL